MPPSPKEMDSNTAPDALPFLMGGFLGFMIGTISFNNPSYLVCRCVWISTAVSVGLACQFESGLSPRISRVLLLLVAINGFGISLACMSYLATFGQVPSPVVASLCATLAVFGETAFVASVALLYSRNQSVGVRRVSAIVLAAIVPTVCFLTQPKLGYDKRFGFKPLVVQPTIAERIVTDLPTALPVHILIFGPIGLVALNQIGRKEAPPS